MANTSSNKKLVPEAMDSLDRFKYEVASEVGVKKLFKNYNLLQVATSYLFILNI